VTLALRPEVIGIASAETSESNQSPNTTSALVEQVIYHGFVTHLHLRLSNGDPLIAFRQHGPGLGGIPISPGMRVFAHWADDAAQVVRDEID